MNHRFSSIEELKAYESRCRAIEYDARSHYIVHEMTRLRLLFTSPWMVVRDGVVVSSGENWTDQNAAMLYQKYEHALQLLKTQILNSQ